MTEYHVTLTEEDFAQLVRGGVVERGPVKITLANVTWDRMYFHIEKTVREKDPDRAC